MSFKPGDKVRRKKDWLDDGGWHFGTFPFTVVENCNFLMILRDVPDCWDPRGFELVEAATPASPTSTIRSWSHADIGPFDIQVGWLSGKSAWDALDMHWFKNPVGQKLNALEIEYKESPDMTDEILAGRILSDMQALPEVDKVVIDWKAFPHGIVWER